MKVQGVVEGIFVGGLQKYTVVSLVEGGTETQSWLIVRKAMK